MAKEKEFTAAEKNLLKARGMPWRLWRLMQRYPNYILICNRVNGSVRVIEKEQIPS